MSSISKLKGLKNNGTYEPLKINDDGELKTDSSDIINKLNALDIALLETNTKLFNLSEKLITENLNSIRNEGKYFCFSQHTANNNDTDYIVMSLFNPSNSGNNLYITCLSAGLSFDVLDDQFLKYQFITITDGGTGGNTIDGTPLKINNGINDTTIIRRNPQNVVFSPMPNKILATRQKLLRTANIDKILLKKCHDTAYIECPPGTGIALESTGNNNNINIQYNYNIEYFIESVN